MPATIARGPHAPDEPHGGGATSHFSPCRLRCTARARKPKASSAMWETPPLEGKAQSAVLAQLLISDCLIPNGRLRETLNDQCTPMPAKLNTCMSTAAVYTRPKEALNALRLMQDVWLDLLLVCRQASPCGAILLGSYLHKIATALPRDSNPKLLAASCHFESHCILSCGIDGEGALAPMSIQHSQLL